MILQVGNKDYSTLLSLLYASCTFVSDYSFDPHKKTCLTPRCHKKLRRVNYTTSFTPRCHCHCQWYRVFFLQVRVYREIETKFKNTSAYK